MRSGGGSAGSVGPRFAETETLAEVVQAEGIGKRGAVAACACSVMGFDDLVDDPSCDEEPEDAVFVGERDEDGEDDEVDDAFGVLAVVHGADAGDETEQGSQAGVGFSGSWRVANSVDIGAGGEAARIGGGASRCACSG